MVSAIEFLGSDGKRYLIGHNGSIIGLYRIEQDVATPIGYIEASISNRNSLLNYTEVARPWGSGMGYVAYAIVGHGAGYVDVASITVDSNGNPVVRCARVGVDLDRVDSIEYNLWNHEVVVAGVSGSDPVLFLVKRDGSHVTSGVTTNYARYVSQDMVEPYMVVSNTYRAIGIWGRVNLGGVAKSRPISIESIVLGDVTNGGTRRGMTIDGGIAENFNNLTRPTYPGGFLKYGYPYGNFVVATFVDQYVSLLAGAEEQSGDVLIDAEGRRSNSLPISGYGNAGTDVGNVGFYMSYVVHLRDYSTTAIAVFNVNDAYPYQDYVEILNVEVWRSPSANDLPVIVPGHALFVFTKYQPPSFSKVPVNKLYWSSIPYGTPYTDLAYIDFTISNGSAQQDSCNAQLRAGDPPMNETFITLKSLAGPYARVRMRDLRFSP